jgi:hypothetical protein
MNKRIKFKRKKRIIYQLKETKIVEYIINKFKNYDWKVKETIEGTGKSVDLLLDLKYIIIIIEIDENQHRNYKNEDERMEVISKALGRPTIFIRFNPDDYLDVNRNNVESCFEKDKMNIYRISNKYDWQNRLNSLISEIKKWINLENKTNKLLSVKYLYYDRSSRYKDSDDDNSETDNDDSDSTFNPDDSE